MKRRRRTLDPDFRKALELLMTISHIIASPTCKVQIEIPEELAAEMQDENEDPLACVKGLEDVLRQALTEAGGLLQKWMPEAFEDDVHGLN